MKFLIGGIKSLYGDFFAAILKNENLIYKEELILFIISGLANMLNLKKEELIIFIISLFYTIMYGLNELRSNNILEDIIFIIIVYNIFKDFIDDDILISFLISLVYGGNYEIFKKKNVK